MVSLRVALSARRQQDSRTAAAVTGPARIQGPGMAADQRFEGLVDQFQLIDPKHVDERRVGILDHAHRIDDGEPARDLVQDKVGPRIRFAGAPRLQPDDQHQQDGRDADESGDSGKSRP